MKATAFSGLGEYFPRFVEWDQKRERQRLFVALVRASLYLAGADGSVFRKPVLEKQKIAGE